MKKMILLCGFGLLGSFVLAGEPVENKDAKTPTGEPKTETTCGCETNPDGTCTIYITTGGVTTVYGPYTNVTIQWCAWKRDQLAFAAQQ